MWRAEKKCLPEADTFFSLILGVPFPIVAVSKEGTGGALGISGGAHGSSVEHHPVAEIGGLLRRQHLAQLLLHLATGPWTRR